MGWFDITKQQRGVKMSKFNLVGIDGNAFNIMSYVRSAMRQCGFSREKIDKYKTDAMSGDYNHLLVISFDMIDQCNDAYKAYVDDYDDEDD